MKYGNGQVDKIKRFLKEHKVTAFECMDEYTVSIITNVVNSDEIDKLKNQTVTNQKLNRLFFDQMVARDLVKIHHETSGATGLKCGYVYLITNPAWPEWIKVGGAVDINDRLRSYQTSCPLRDYQIEYYFFSFDRRLDERKLLEKYNASNEWICASLDEVKEYCRQLSPYRKQKRHFSV